VRFLQITYGSKRSALAPWHYSKSCHLSLSIYLLGNVRMQDNKSNYLMVVAKLNQRLGKHLLLQETVTVSGYTILRTLCVSLCIIRLLTLNLLMKLLSNMHTIRPNGLEILIIHKIALGGLVVACLALDPQHYFLRGRSKAVSPMT
jgi:hypothetical protein